jgi:hypothetical protein
VRYKIEVIYASGWDDAEWSEEANGVSRPLRFKTAGSAQTALDDYFSSVKTAVAAGFMDREENPNHYRIAAVK